MKCRIYLDAQLVQCFKRRQLQVEALHLRALAGSVELHGTTQVSPVQIPVTGS